MSSEIPEQLKKIRDNRALILLVELMGLLHDIGKLRRPESEEKPFPSHTKGEDISDLNLPKSFKTPFKELFKNKDNSYLIPEESIKLVKGVTIEGFKNHHGARSRNWIEQIINLADNKDSSEDRGKAIAKQKDFKASVFGREKELEEEKIIEEKRRKICEELEKIFSKVIESEKIKRNADWKEFHFSCVELIKKYFSDSLAETERAANDVTLFDHSYMTGSISKALTAKAIINPEIVTSFQPMSNTHHFDKELDLDLLMVSFDGFEFISEGVNLLDVRGRKIVLEEIKGSVKDLLEVKYPVGNCIYEDENNLCFLVTPLGNNLDYLKREIYGIFNERTFSILVPVIGRRQKLKYYGKGLTELKEENEKFVNEGFIKDFIPKWIEEWKNIKKKERCILCRKLPQREGKDSENLCEFCWNLRYEVTEKAEKEDSPWIDEITDENGKVVLVIGAFYPLNKWLSGEFLNYQKIRTKKDLRNFVSGKINFEEAAKKFIECFPDEMKKRKGFVELLRSTIGNLDKRFEKEWKILGGGSKVGEVYYRLSDENQQLLKESKLSEDKVEKMAQDLVKVTTTKPSSPSRLHRIWRELEEFSESVIEGSRKKVLKGKQLKFSLKEFKGERGIYDVIIPDIGRVEAFFDEGNEEFNTIERIDINKPADKSSRIDEEEFLEKHLEFEKIKEKLKHGKIEIYKDGVKKGFFEIKAVNFEGYKQFKAILVSPNGFLFVIPANKALTIVRSIKDRFNEEFSKVLGNISLNIGVIFSYRKFPIYITLDCARRMVSEFNSFDSEEVKVDGKRDSAIKLMIDGKRVEMNISDRLGDGKDDLYYPYLRSANDDAKQIKEINPTDKLKLILSRFDFEFLDSSSRRFDMMLNKNKRRKHSIIGENGPRPYLLEDLKDVKDLWDIMNKKLTHSQIKNLEYLCASKIEEWGLKDVIGNNTPTKEEKKKVEIFNEFVKSSVENICGKLGESQKEDEKLKEKIHQSILSGMFFDVVELFIRLKIKSLSPFDAVALALGDFQYTKEKRREAEEWLLEQVRKDPNWENYFEEDENANS